MRALYPPIEARAHHFLDVAAGHRIHFEESGAAAGKPVVVLHGGPGGGSSPRHRQFFDPAAYRIVLLDQRGCNLSTPRASVEHNTTWDLVDDLERVRTHLGLDRWCVFGGSWGSTLALAYAQAHPERVTELVLRGVFLVRRSELEWFYQDGAGRIYPDAWEEYLAPIPVDERGDLLAAYHRRLHGDDRAVMVECSRAWTGWERATSFLVPEVEEESDDEVVQMARIESHYFAHGAFFGSESQLLDGIDRIRHIPAVIVQGRYDVVCPMRSAWDLHRVWPEAQLVVNARAGHSMFDPENAAALVEATDQFR